MLIYISTIYIYDFIKAELYIDCLRLLVTIVLDDLKYVLF